MVSRTNPKMAGLNTFPQKIIGLTLTLFVVMGIGLSMARQHKRHRDRDRDLLKDTVGFSRDTTRLQDEKKATWTNKKNKSNRKKSDKPNIIMFMTDDQDIELGSMNFMPKTLRILRDGGAYFPNAFVSTPMCCPSRSSMLTGMYVHNHNVYTNNDNCSSLEWQQKHETRSFGTYLTNTGYRTGYFGKYLNEYNGSYIPPGWTEWVGLVKNTRFYNYTLNFNGKKIKHYDNYYKDYLTDLIANDSVTFLKQSKQYFPNRPVAMVLSMPAPHGPEDAAPQYQHLFENVTTYRTPSYNFAPNPDKQWILQYTGKMEPIHAEFTDMLHRKRLQTLQSVDDAVEKLFLELKNLGELDNTYLIYTSDHGYHIGQYGLVKGKAMPYEFDIKVPFYIRGPKVPGGVRVPTLMGNIDLAPTFLDMAGVEIPEHMDGISLLPLFEGIKGNGGIVRGELKRKKAWRDTILIERGKINDKKLKSRERLEAQHNRIALKINKETRLESECQKLEYHSPCSKGQQWECKKSEESGKYRIYKCRSTKKRRIENDVLPPKLCDCSASYMFQAKKTNMLMDRAEKRKQRLFLKNNVNQPTEVKKHRFLKIKGQRRKRHLMAVENTADASSQEISDDDSYLDPDVTQLSELERKELLLKEIDSRDRQGSAQGSIEEMFNNEEKELGDHPETMEGQPMEDPQPDQLLDLGVPSPNLGKSEPAGSLPHTGKSPRSEPAVSGKPVSCRVMPNNTVVCEQEMYHSMDYWKDQKEKLDRLIQEYRFRLNKLKDLRKHLKFTRPTEVAPTTPSPTEPPPTADQEMDIESLFEAAAEDREDDEEEEETDQELTDCNCDIMLDQPRWDSRHVDLGPNRVNKPHPLRTESKVPKRNKKFEERERKRQERREKKREKKQEREGKGGKQEGNNVEVTKDCNSPNLKCFTQTNDHWSTPPLWNSTSTTSSPVHERHSRQDPACHREGMECSKMDSSHWKVAPRWNLGPFCFCPNSNNNTYWCIRTINESHNFLYCEFITGFISYYNILKDPYQLRNAVYDLEHSVLQKLHNTLEKLKSCRGRKECTIKARPQDVPDFHEVEGSGEVENSGDIDSDQSSINNEIQIMASSGEEEELDPLKEELLYITNNLRLDDPRLEYDPKSST